MPEHRIIRPAEAHPSWRGSTGKFTGPTQIHQIAQALGLTTAGLNYLTFDAGARCRPHRHDAAQVLLFTRGPGVIAIDGGPDELVAEGRFVLLPGGIVHMHGASDDGPAAHVSLMPAVHTTEWDMAVPEAWRRFLPELELPEEERRYMSDAGPTPESAR